MFDFLSSKLFFPGFNLTIFQKKKKKILIMLWPHGSYFSNLHSKTKLITGCVGRKLT